MTQRIIWTLAAAVLTVTFLLQASYRKDLVKVERAELYAMAAHERTWEAATDSMGWSGGTNAAGDTLWYPVLVFGQGGEIKSVSVNIPDATGATDLYFTVTGLKYSDKGEVRVNGGTWQLMNDANMTCVFGEAEEYAGACGDIFPLLWVEMDFTDDWVTGLNTVEFKFNRGALSGGLIAADPGHGYRIAVDGSFEVRNQADAKVDGINGKNELPYGNWPIGLIVPGYDNADSIAAGQTYFNDHIIAAEGVTCQDCHWRDGTDIILGHSEPIVLEAASDNRFGVGNFRVDAITAYVLSAQNDSLGNGFLKSTWPVGVNPDSVGRMWALAYQPCDGNTDRSAIEWLMGSAVNNFGVDCILDHDSLMVNEFNDFYNDDWHVTDKLDVLNQEISLQLPSILEWYPRRHPITCVDDFTTAPDSPWQTYQNEFLPALASGNMTTLHNDTDDLWGDADDFAVQNVVSLAADPLCTNGTTIVSYDAWEHGRVFFGMMDYHDYMTRMDEVDPRAQPFQWPGDIARIPFDMAPHIGLSSGSIKGGHEDRWGFDNKNHFWDHTWYEAQIYTSVGIMSTAQFRPMDWKYHFGHAKNYQSNGGDCGTDISSGVRRARDWVYLMQNGYSVSDMYMRHLTPAWFMAATVEDLNNASQFCGQMLKSYKDNITLRDRLAEQTLRPLTQFVLSEQAKPSWSCGGDYEFACSGYTPTLGNGGTKDDEVTDTWVSVMDVLHQFGTMPTLVDSMAQVGVTEGWNFDFSPYLTTGTVPDSVVLSAPAAAATGVLTTPTFTWVDVADETSYTLDIDTVNTFNSAYYRTYSLGQNVVQYEELDQLAYDEEHFWRVQASNLLGSGPWSEIRSFTVESDPNTWTEYEYGGNTCLTVSQQPEYWDLDAKARGGLLRRRGEIEACIRTVDIADGDSAIVTVDSLRGNSTSRYRTFGLFVQDQTGDYEPFGALTVSGKQGFPRLRVIERTTTNGSSAFLEGVPIQGSADGYQLLVKRSGADFTFSYRATPQSAWTNLSSTVTLTGLSGVAKGGIVASSGTTADTLTAYFKWDIQ